MRTVVLGEESYSGPILLGLNIFTHDWRIGVRSTVNSSSLVPI